MSGNFTSHFGHTRTKVGVAKPPVYRSARSQDSGVVRPGHCHGQTGNRFFHPKMRDFSGLSCRRPTAATIPMMSDRLQLPCRFSVFACQFWVGLSTGGVPEIVAICAACRPVPALTPGEPVSGPSAAAGVWSEFVAMQKLPIASMLCPDFHAACLWHVFGPCFWVRIFVSCHPAIASALQRKGGGGRNFLKSVDQILIRFSLTVLKTID